jgi:hypothetical protein
MALAPVRDIAMSGMDELSALSGNAALSARAQETLNAALAGKASAMNEVIDGMLNDRFGFEKNRDLAIQLTKQLAATGDAEGRLKLAYMQYQGSFEGVNYNPKAALATIKDLGRSWVGGEALLSKAGLAVRNLAEQATIPTAEIVDTAPVSITIDPEAVVPESAQQVVSCTMSQLESLDLSIKCDAPTGEIKEGNFIFLRKIFRNGAEQARKLFIDAIPMGQSGSAYLENRMAAEAAMFDPPVISK